MATKKALITGVAGQDGSYLAEFLLKKDYAVYGLDRKDANADIVPGVNLVSADILDRPSLREAISSVQPDEIYHLAAYHDVGGSFRGEKDALETNIFSTQNLLSVLKELKINCRFCFAASGEIFGQAKKSSQNEETPIEPVSPYGISKAAAYFLVKMYRAAHDLFACNAILFNHESPRRHPRFVTRKITLAAAEIKLGIKKDKLNLGNLEVKRDWGFAGDYVEAMWLMLQREKPDDYVIGTGEVHSIKEFLRLAFERVGLNWEDCVAVDPTLFRSAEIHERRADISKAKKILGWRPVVGFGDLARMMVEADLEYVKRRSA